MTTEKNRRYNDTKHTPVGNIKNSSIVIIIPAYNEEERIGPVIESIQKDTRDIDIVVIDDGSTDKTGPIASQSGAFVIKHIYNMGYGSSLQTGFKFALKKNYDYAVQIDADGQHDTKNIHDLIRIVINDEADVALGSRFLGIKNYKPTLSRKIGMLFFATIASVFTGQNVTDPTSGYQALNKSVIKLYASDMYPTDYPDADVLIMLYKMGLKVKEIPVVMYDDVSKQITMHSGLKPLYYIFKMCLSIFVTLLRKYE